MARVTTERYDVVAGTDLEFVLESDCTAVRVMSNFAVIVTAYSDQDRTLVSATSGAANANSIISDPAVGRFIGVAAQGANTFYIVIKQYD